MTNKPNPDFDIAVCGGGMVGATLSALLAHEPVLKGLRIALIEAHFPAQAPNNDIEIRVSAISRASERILTRCGAWSLIDVTQRCAYQDMVVWDAASTAPNSDHRAEALHFSASAMGEPNLGNIIANNCVQWAALEAATHAGVTRFAAALSAIKLEDNTARIALSDGRTFTARLIIGADGANSASRECVGISARVKPYQQTALVTHVRTELSHQHTAWQRFLADGPIAFLPLNDGRSSIVWTTTPDRATELLQLDEAKLASEITTASDHVLGAVTIAGTRATFPLQLAQVDEYCRPRFVLVGDAAHSMHPLAGQGVNLGLMDAAALVQTLADARSAGASIDALSEMRVLRRYERWRKTENTIALGMVDALNRLFSNNNTSARVLRRTGLRAVENMPVLKRAFMLRALGLAGEVPESVTGTG